MNNSYTVFFNFSSSSLTTAQALIPYVGIPSCDIITKYVTTELANETLPVPAGSSTLDTYGNVISGNKKLDIVSIAFIIKFSFNDFCLLIITALSLQIHYLFYQ